MIFWFDAVTAKEPLLFNAIAKELEQLGHEAIFTCRDYDYVASLGNHTEYFSAPGDFHPIYQGHKKLLDKFLLPRI